MEPMEKLVREGNEERRVKDCLEIRSVTQWLNKSNFLLRVQLNVAKVATFNTQIGSLFSAI